MDNDGRRPLLLRECLRVVSKRLGLGGSLEAGRLWRSWAEIAGSAIAEHAEPTSLRDGVLRIRTNSPAWATELGYMGAEIARRANATLGASVVSEVRVWTAPGPIARAAAAPSGRAGVGERGAVEAREPSSDPTRALARARAAWGRRRGLRRDPENQGKYLVDGMIEDVNPPRNALPTRASKRSAAGAAEAAGWTSDRPPSSI